MNDQATALLLMGAPRSGLSALAGCLSRLGVNLGATLLEEPPPHDPPLSEHADVISVHDTLLRELGLSWDDPAPLPPDWLETSAARQARERIEQLIHSRFADSPLWAVHDHRLCRLLPLWLEVLDGLHIRACPVLLLRHPDEVSQSLERHTGLAPEAASMLWFFSNQWALQCTASHGLSLATYDALLADPFQVLENLALDWNLTWPRSPSDQAMDVLDSLCPEQKHCFVRTRPEARHSDPYVQAYRSLKLHGVRPRSALESQRQAAPLPMLENDAPMLRELLNDLLVLATRYRSQSRDESEARATSGAPSSQVSEVSHEEVSHEEVAALKAQLAQSTHRWEQTAGVLAQVVSTNRTLLGELSARMNAAPPHPGSAHVPAQTGVEHG